MSLINRNEIRRLEKAAREKDKRHLIDWADKLEQQIQQDIERQLEYRYNLELGNAVDTIMVAVAYALNFSEETSLDRNNIADFMHDLFVTIDLYRTGEYKPEDYVQQLKDVGVSVDRYDYDRIYKQHINSMNDDLVQYIKNRPRKMITICGNPEYKDIILEKYQELSENGNMVFIDVSFSTNLDYADKEVFIGIQKDKILLSDMVFVVNKDKKINDVVKDEIEFAKSHNIQIKYLEE